MLCWLSSNVVGENIPLLCEEGNVLSHASFFLSLSLRILLAVPE